MIDFTGLATAYGILCQDGRTIYEGAFDHQDGQTVPIVWRHNHGKISDVLGHGVLRKSAKPPGMRIEATFNTTSEGVRGKKLVAARDVTKLSIWANELIEHATGANRRGVEKGWIREVSLVLAGSNPGARIEDVVIHSEDPTQPDIIIMDGIIAHSDESVIFHDDGDGGDSDGDSGDSDASDSDSDGDDSVDLETTEDLLEEEEMEEEPLTVEDLEALIDAWDEEYGEDDSIKHFGVKGMKWGVRKDKVRRGIKKSISPIGFKETRPEAIKSFKNDPFVKLASKVGKAAVTPQGDLKADIAAFKGKVSAKIRGRQQKFADQSKADSETSKKIGDSMSAEARGGKKRTSEQLRSESKSLKKIKNRAFLVDDYEQLNRMEKTAAKEAKGAKRRSPQQLKKDASIMKRYSDTAERERAAWQTYIDKGRTKHSSEMDELVDIVHINETLYDVLGTLDDDQEQLFDIILHAAAVGEITAPSAPATEVSSGPTVSDVFDTLNSEQTDLLYYLADELSPDEDTLSQEGDTELMTTNIFEQDAEGTNEAVIAHKAIVSTLNVAQTTHANSLRALFAQNEIVIEDRSLSHSVTDIDNMFPDAKLVEDGGPMFYSRPMEWVEMVLTRCKTRPFSRIKSQYADITADAARAKGYVTGNLKVEEVIAVLKRVTTPQTIYKLQKLDRDDILDITDFDIVIWLKGEMRMMLREEIARAVLISDGRANTGNDAILTANVRPIYNDSDVYTHKAIYNDNVEALANFTNTELLDLIDFIAESMIEYRGSGSPVFYTSPELAIKLMLIRDADGHRLHRTKAELSDALGVSDILKVPPMTNFTEDDVTDPSGVPEGTYDLHHLGVIVNLADYVIGADRGGQTSFFDDFDIDYNKHTYLYETRMSGALVNPKSAIAVSLATDYTAP